MSELVVGGVLPYPSMSATLAVGQSDRRPVLGGSGRYAGATGYVTSINRGSAGWLHVFHLRH